MSSGVSIGTIASYASLASTAFSIYNGVTGGTKQSAVGYDQASGQAMTPWWQGPGGQDASTQLQALMKGPSTILSDPVYNAFNNQSLDDLQRRTSASGLRGSGNEVAGLQQQSMANSNQFYQQQVQNLMSMAGTNMNPAGGVQQGLNAQGQANTLAGQNQAGIMQGIGGAAQNLKGLYGNSNNNTTGGLEPGMQNYYSLQASGLVD